MIAEGPAGSSEFQEGDDDDNELTWRGIKS